VSSFRPSGILAFFPGSIHMKNFSTARHPRPRAILRWRVRDRGVAPSLFLRPLALRPEKHRECRRACRMNRTSAGTPEWRGLVGAFGPRIMNEAAEVVGK
jgi:hypothetical protein